MRASALRMPAEWEPHAATWLSWPHKEESWPGKFAPIPGIFAEMVRLLSPGERVCINVNDEEMERSVRAILERAGACMDNVRFYLIPTNDAWCRDHGPIFVWRENGIDPQLTAIDWNFNSWGGKYPPFDLDDRVPARIAEQLGIPRISPGIVMEGGSIDVNGTGSLLTTRSCLLNPNRNPHLSRGEIEIRLREHLGARNILWLGEGIAGDDTDGHVDDLARFVDRETIVTMVEDDPADENHAPLRENLEMLHGMKDERGRAFRILSISMPPARFHEGCRLPCSYANFYIGNEVVLVPVFGAPSDAAALETLQRLFPGRRVRGIECADMVWGLGALHCVTQQQPGTPPPHGKNK